tara:strand:- start:1165 stop:1350 length:186 start_codon:yes stop_codon:yes gene_type:complete
MFYLNLLSTYFIILIIYFVFIIPAGLILRLFKKDILDLKFQIEKKSYWIEKKSKNNIRSQY